MYVKLSNTAKSNPIPALAAGGSLSTQTDSQGCVWLGETNWSKGVPLGYKTADPIFTMAKQSAGFVLAMPPLHTTQLIFLVLGDRSTTFCFCQPSLVPDVIMDVQAKLGVAFQPYVGSPIYDKNPLATAPLGLLAPLTAYTGVAYAILYRQVQPAPAAMFASKLLA